MKRIVVIAAVVALAVSFVSVAAAETPPVREARGYTPVPPKEGHEYPECFCTDSGGRRVELGQTACLRIGSSRVLARCAMSLNNPTWRRVSEGCPTS